VGDLLLHFVSQNLYCSGQIGIAFVILRLVWILVGHEYFGITLHCNALESLAALANDQANHVIGNVKLINFVPITIRYKWIGIRHRNLNILILKLSLWLVAAH